MVSSGGFRATWECGGWGGGGVYGTLFHLASKTWNENETMVARRKMAVVIMGLFSLRMRVIGNKSSDK